MSKQTRKKISLIIAILGFLFLTEGMIKNFEKIKFLYAYYYEPTSFMKDELIIKSFHEEINEDTGVTSIYVYIGNLKKDKVKTQITANKNSIERNKNGNILVWRYKFKNKSRTFQRTPKEEFPPLKFTYSSWLATLFTILFLPALIYYSFLKRKIKKLKND